MSRAVTEDLSHLSFQDRMSKRWENFTVWVHNSEKKTWFGERPAVQWGQLLLYYLCFYCALATFTSIFFAILGTTLPHTPYQVVPGLCNSVDVNAIDYCGDGPVYTAKSLYRSKKREGIRTDSVLSMSLCEPAFTALPRSLNIKSEPSSGFNSDESRVGYNLFFDELDRVFCKGAYNGTLNPACASTAPVTKILPLVPKDTSSYYSIDEFSTLGKSTFSELSDADAHSKPKSLYSFSTVDGGEYNVFIVLFRFNKVWNFEPYSEAKTTDVQAVIQNKIGLRCELSSHCEVKNDKDKTVDHAGNFKRCSKDSTPNGEISIDILSNVMVNSGGFPWVGGALDMNFGSLAVIHKKDTDIPSGLEILCTMGDQVSAGRAYINQTGEVEEVKAFRISNMNKQGPANLYSRSDGASIAIPIN